MIYLLLGLCSLALALLFTPLVSRAAARIGLVDAPGGRKVHPRSVPRLGGVAIVGATVLGMILVPYFRPGDFGPAIWAALRPFAVAGAMIFAIGLIDDVRGVNPAPKLVVQTLAAGVLMASGLLIERITILGVSWDLGWIAWPVTAAWMVGLTNAFNLIDGIDGLAAGIAALAGATCGAILIARGHTAEAMLLAALVGATLGFLVFNFAPASIFLGDSGSLLFGFLLAGTAIAGWQKGATALATAVPLLIFALPIADVVSTVIRRGRARQNQARASVANSLRRLVQPDREHIHHQLLALGWSHKRIAFTLYVVTALLCLLALSTAQTN